MPFLAYVTQPITTSHHGSSFNPGILPGIVTDTVTDTMMLVGCDRHVTDIGE